MKNSSRFDVKIARNFTRSSSGALVEGLGQNARVEIEPAQIAVDPHVGQRRRQRRVQDSGDPRSMPTPMR